MGTARTTHDLRLGLLQRLLRSRTQGLNPGRLLNTMEVLGFTVDEQNSIFRILSSVLHLGNVYFEKYEVCEPTRGSALLTRFGVHTEGMPCSITLCPADRLPGDCNSGECHRDPDGG